MCLLIQLLYVTVILTDFPKTLLRESDFIEKLYKFGMVVHVHNPALRRWRQEDHKFRVILSYTESLRPTGNT